MKTAANRLVFGSLLIAAVAALLWADLRLEQSNYRGLLPGEPRGALFALLAFLLIAGSAVELARMARARGLEPLTAVGALAAAALAVAPFLATLFPRWPTPAVWLLAGGTMAVFFCQATARRTADAISNIAATLLGVVYLGGLALFVVQIRVEFGLWALVAYLAAVKFTDIGAYAAGSNFGRHKMIRWLSPGKSWEGLAGGAVAAVAAAMAVAIPTGLLGWWQAAVFGLVLAPVGQLGDLAESLLKRDSGEKDSARLIPSFGGLLDLIDSPLGAAPVGYLLLLLLR